MVSPALLPWRRPAAWRQLLLAGALGATLHAAENPGELFSLSMEELSQLEIKSDIGSIKARALEEIPAIVSVVPSRQIRESGARDLSDVLLLVPGYALDQDVQSMIGLTFRGLQGQEGKVMVVLDGIEINESLYGSLPILNHFPADIIEQVEIIRGPGAAQYGGSAGLSVIRITTKGGSANQGYAVFAPAYANGHLSTSYAAGLSRTQGDWRVSFNGAFRRDRLSGRTYVSGDGNTTDLGETSAMKPSLLAFGLGWKALDVRCIVDRYQYDDGVNYGEIPARPSDMHFDSLLATAKYEARIGEWLRIVPQFTYRRQKPWLQHNEELGVFDILAERLQGDLTGIATLTPNTALMVGVRWQRDRAQANDTSVAGEDPAGYFFGTDRLVFADKAAFAQVDIDTKWVNLTLGGRYERHDAVAASSCRASRSRGPGTGFT